MEIELMFQNYLQKLKDKNSQGYVDFATTNIKIIITYFSNLSIYDTSELSFEVIYDFITYFRKKKNNCNSTLKKKFGLIKRSLDYSDIHIDLSKIEIGRVKSKPFKKFNAQQLKIIIKYYFNLDFSNLVNFTKYIAVMLLLHTGVRRTELCRIKINHIDFKTCSIYLDETKTGDERIVYFRNYMIKDLKKYISLKERQYLMYNFRTESVLTPTNVSDFIKYDKRAMGLKKYSAHMFRHTFASNMIQNGGSLLAVKNFLGHRSLKTTQIYTQPDDEFLQNDYQKHSFNLK